METVLERLFLCGATQCGLSSHHIRGLITPARKAHPLPAMPAPKRRAPSAKGAKAGSAKKKGKKTAADDLPDAYGDLFLGDDDDKKKKPDDDVDEDDAEAKETAEEKRLRLARAYLNQMQSDVERDEGGHWGVTQDQDEEESGSSGDEQQQHQRQAKLGKDLLTQRLKHDAAEASGRVQRKLAHQVQVPEFLDLGGDRGSEVGVGPGSPSSAAAQAAARAACRKGHRLAATAVVLSSDDSFAVSVSKDGSIMKWDLQSMNKTRLYRAGEEARCKAGRRAKTVDSEASSSVGPEWVKRNPRQASRQGLYAAALSSDDKLLAVGGGDKKVHVFDAVSGAFLQSFSGHKDAVSGLAFREGSHQLFSASLDRTVKMWSLDDRAYMDTLFGHQAEVLALDVLRAERAITAASDHSCRIWKVPEESQLVFRTPTMSTDCVRLISQGEFISGGSEGLQVWNQLRKKPMSTAHQAHGPGAAQQHGGASAGCLTEEICGSPLAPATVPDVVGWVQALAVCRNSDFAASGASDGTVRLWRIDKNKMGGAQSLHCIGGLPVRGCVNGLAISRSGRLVVAAVGQEPRLGRWMRDGAAKNGIVVYRLAVKS